MEEAAEIILKRIPFHSFIEKYSLLFYENKIVISLSTDTSFTDLNNIEKFSLLQNIHIQFLHLLDGFNAKNKVLREIKIISLTDGKIIEYSDKNKTKANYMAPNGLLKENDRTILTKKEYSKSCAINNTTITYQEQQIIDYMIRLFKIMTKNGLDYNPQNDHNLILANTIERFKVDKETIDLIIKKYIDHEKIKYKATLTNQKNLVTAS